MPHSFSKIWIHTVLVTQDHLPFLEDTIKERVYEHIRQELKEQGCPMLIANGMPDHVHVLFLLSAQKSLAEVIKQLKRSTAAQINQQEEFAEQREKVFSWHPGYAAYSVSETAVDKMFQYIKNQEQHHAMHTFQEEYRNLNTLYRKDEE